jgi:ADP-heptose:LPS heptosyltransferase
VKKALLTRFGGLGDNAPLTVVGKQLKKQGYHVTFACRYDGENHRQSEMFIQNPSFDEVLDLKMHGPWGTRCIKTQLGWASISSIYKDFDLVLDYMNIIENNNTSPVIKEGPGNDWQKSRNSNWRNWYDLHLEWANIDPTKVSDDDKRPIYALLPGEKEVFASLKQDYSHVFVVQTNASSLSRTWYQAEKLPKALMEAYSNPVVAFWDSKANVWVLVTKKGYSRLEIPGMSPLRMSMALLSQADLFIGADTGMSHVAEGLGVKHIALYSTVPSWTRAKYYKFQTPIDPGVNNPEFYTFNLGLGDPLRVLEGMAGLSEREQLVGKLYSEGMEAAEAAEILNTDVEGARMELQALMAKKASWDRMQSKALSTIKPETVMEKVKELCSP